ncbi:hypothetical protein [Sulfitobacter sediminilitoris]|nr:hypothetical protein [Sulfitobacter sediminilitoris]
MAATVVSLICATAVSTADNSKGGIQMETGRIGEEMIGKSFSEAEQKLGKPIREDRFELGTAVLEFRIELTNIFDEVRRAENPPDVREVTWSMSPEENLTLWFTQPKAGADWFVVHSYVWHPDAQF